jgi:hypothetical protein
LAGSNKTPLESAMLPSGTYILIGSFEGKQITKKLVKIEYLISNKKATFDYRMWLFCLGNSKDTSSHQLP